MAATPSSYSITMRLHTAPDHGVVGQVATAISEAGGIVTRDDIVNTVWEGQVSEGVTEDAMDALVRRLRARLAEIDPLHQYVVTVRGYGFKLDLP